MRKAGYIFLIPFEPKYFSVHSKPKIQKSRSLQQVCKPNLVCIATYLPNHLPKANFAPIQILEPPKVLVCGIIQVALVFLFFQNNSCKVEFV